MEGDRTGLTIDPAPSGRNGRITLTARLNGEPICVDELNVKSDKARAAFVAKVCNGRPGIDAAAVEAELLRLAAEVASKPDGAPADLGALPELDVSCIIRPERFIVPEVSGLSVPTMTTLGDQPVGRRLLYLRWSDGRRQLRPLPTSLEAPEGRRLWIHPTPPEPTASTPSGWSAQRRREWLAGAAAPDPADVFRRLCERVAYFIDLPKEHAPGMLATLVLWVLLTYCYLAWDAVPYLYVGGPLHSGKTRVFEILARLVFRPLGSSNMSAAAMFRTLHSQGGTLLLDEAERLKQTQAPEVQEMLSMLLAGYKRGGQATRLEPVGDTFKTVSFDVYSPKALACVAGLPPALASRAIGVTMFRAAPGSEKPRRRIDADKAGWQRLRDDLHALAMEHGSTWLELPNRVEVCPTMSGRDFELWQPLLALASWVESYGFRGLLGMMQRHALETIDVGKDDQTPDSDETLLRILAEAVRFGERPTPHEILDKAQKAEPVVFKNWYPRTVTGRLKAYGIKTPKKSGARREFRDVTTDTLRRIQTAYGIDLDIPDDENDQSAQP